MEIEFIPLSAEHFDLIHRWVNADHIVNRWDGKQTIAEVKKKYGEKIASDIVFPFIVTLYGNKIGYIQKYEARRVGGGWWQDMPEGSWGIDQFIGEKDFLRKGIGSTFVRRFTNKLSEDKGVSKIIVDPTPDNHRAIRAYENAGFVGKGLIETPDGSAHLMEFVERNLAYYLDQWHLQDEKLLAETSTSKIHLVSKNENRFVLKYLNEEGIRDKKYGASALLFFDGEGAVRLINSDFSAHLIDYIDGVDLVRMVRRGQDDEATAIICDVLSRLHRPKQRGEHRFISLRERYRSLFETADQSSVPEIFKMAAKEAKLLLDTSTEEVVLHGDIHHENVMYCSTRGWIAIDPKGLFGERTYDATNILFNPNQITGLVIDKGRIERQAHIICTKLGLEMSRFLKFAFTYGCLSASWSLKDGQDPSQTLEVAEIIRRSAIH